MKIWNKEKEKKRESKKKAIKKSEIIVFLFSATHRRSGK
jgi:hypothetical protein